MEGLLHRACVGEQARTQTGVWQREGEGSGPVDRAGRLRDGLIAAAASGAESKMDGKREKRVARASASSELIEIETPPDASPAVSALSPVLSIVPSCPSPAQDGRHPHPRLDLPRGPQPHAHPPRIPPWPLHLPLVHARGQGRRPLPARLPTGPPPPPLSPRSSTLTSNV